MTHTTQIRQFHSGPLKRALVVVIRASRAFAIPALEVRSGLCSRFSATMVQQHSPRTSPSSVSEPLLAVNHRGTMHCHFVEDTLVLLPGSRGWMDESVSLMLFLKLRTRKKKSEKDAPCEEEQRGLSVLSKRGGVRSSEQHKKELSASKEQTGRES